MPPTTIKNSCLTVSSTEDRDKQLPFAPLVYVTLKKDPSSKETLDGHLRTRLALMPLRRLPAFLQWDMLTAIENSRLTIYWRSRPYWPLDDGNIQPSDKQTTVRCTLGVCNPSSSKETLNGHTCQVGSRSCPPRSRPACPQWRIC